MSPKETIEMKKFATLLTLIFVAFSVFFCCAFTDTSVNDTSTQTVSWVRITNENTWLYKNPSATEGDKLFVLAYTYYAKVLESTQNGFYYVELLENSSGFVKIYGYVLKDDVTAEEETPVSPTYPTVFTTVKTSNLILFSAPSASSASVCAVYEGQTLYYFGSYPAKDKTWYFVRFGQNLCYVDSLCVTTPAISLHPTPLPTQSVTPPVEETPPTETPEDSVEQTNDFSKLQIAIITLVALSALVVVIILFLPAKSKKQNFENCDASFNGLAPIQQGSASNEPKPRYFDDFL